MPIITPSQTAVMLAEGSESNIGATIGTTTTVISIKSRKKPRKKITAITTTNCAQKPPSRPPRNSLTNSSPPKPRKAEVSMAAPMRMMKTIEVVLAVSIITPCKVSSILKMRHPLQKTPIQSTITAITARNMPKASDAVFIFFTFN